MKTKEELKELRKEEKTGIKARRYRINKPADPAHLVQEIVNLMSREIKTFRQKHSLNTSESKIIIGYMQALTSLAREMRASTTGDQLKNLSDQELLQLIEKAKHTLKTGENVVE